MCEGEEKRQHPPEDHWWVHDPWERLKREDISCWLCHLRCTRQVNLKPQLLSTCDGLTLNAAMITSLTKVGSKVVGGFLVSEQRRDDHEQAVCHRQKSALFPSPSSNVLGLRGQIVGFFTASNHPGELAPHRAQGAMAFRGLSTQAFPTADRVARRDSSPGGEGFGGGKAAHLRPNRCDDHSCANLQGCRQAFQHAHLLGKRDEALLDLSCDLFDGLVQKVERGQDLLQQEALVRLKTAIPCQTKVGDLGTSAPTSQLGQRLGIALPDNQRIEHVPPTFASHITGDRRQLEVSGLQHLVESIDLLCTLLHDGLAVTGQLAQLADRLRGENAFFPQPVPEHISNPLTLFAIRLASGHRFPMVSVDQKHVHMPFEQAVYRFPLHPS